MMSELTPKQEAFALAYVNTGNASEAYRRCYSVKPGTKEATINRSAKELIDNPKISARVAELQATAAQNAVITLESHLEDLKSLRDSAVSDGKWAAAIQAEIARGKAAGHYVDRHEHGGPGGGPIPVTNVPVEEYLAARRQILGEF